ncbi:MAG: hypothetical protein U1F36_02535 [Planctomycetota bacterium]
MVHQASAASATAFLLALATSACSLGSPSVPATSTRFGQGISEIEVQALVMQMADDYDAALGEAVYLVLRKGGIDSTGRWLSLSFLRNGMGAALDIASGPNPDIGLLDLLVLVTLQTQAFEKHWIPAGIDAGLGAAAVARLHQAENSVWAAARRLLSAEQEQTLRQLIADWVAQHPDQTVVAFVRFSDFTEERKQMTAGARAQAAGLLREIDEATVAVEQARLFGERALWFASRYPYLLGQQMELTAYRMADQPEVKDAQRLAAGATSAVEGLADRVRELVPQLSSLIEQVQGVARQTLDDLLQRFDAERAQIAKELEDARGRVEGTLGGARATADAAMAAGQALAAAATAADKVLGRFDRDPVTGEPALRLEDMRDTAIATQHAAERLEGVLVRLQQWTAEDGAPRLLAAVDTSGQEMLNGLFVRGAGWIGVLIVGLALLRLVPSRKR